MASCACLPGLTSLAKHAGKEFSRPLSVAFTPLSPFLLLWSQLSGPSLDLGHQDLKANRTNALSADLLRDS